MDWSPPKKHLNNTVCAFCFPAVRPKINASISHWPNRNGLGRPPYHWINWWWDQHSAVQLCGEEAYVADAAHKSLISLLRLKPFSLRCFAYVLACGNCSHNKSKWYRKILPKLIDRIGIEFVRSFLSHSVVFTFAALDRARCKHFPCHTNRFGQVSSDGSWGIHNFTPTWELIRRRWPHKIDFRCENLQ